MLQPLNASSQVVAKSMALMSKQLDEENDDEDDSQEASDTDGSDQDGSEEEEEDGIAEKDEDEEHGALESPQPFDVRSVLVPAGEHESRSFVQDGKSNQANPKQQLNPQQKAASQHFNQRNQRNQQPHQTPAGDYEEVKQVELFGVSIVALTINGKQRLCLAQISNTLLKDLSYNEIHNRRVALGITCIQCTPIQLEILRRAGAMPSSSRRCGMITLREAERLCRSFLVEEQPPELPENFYFTVGHKVNYGCKGRFVPARYISSRAKCIECFYCGEFYSPNKFIFHSHRQPHNTDCNPPDSPNINSWRKHIDLDWNHEHSQEIKYAWEDVKSLFNGGTRRRAPNTGSGSQSNGANQQQSRSCLPAATSQQRRQQSIKADELGEQLIDVECVSDQPQPATTNCGQLDGSNALFRPMKLSSEQAAANRSLSRGSGKSSWAARYPTSTATRQASGASSLILDAQVAGKPSTGLATPAKRYLSSNGGAQMGTNKRFLSADSFQTFEKLQEEQAAVEVGPMKFALNSESSDRSPCQIAPIGQMRPPGLAAGAQGLPTRAPFGDFLAPTSSSARSAMPSRHHSHHHHQQQQQHSNGRKSAVAQPHSLAPTAYPAASSLTSNFIYSQLYTQLMQPQQTGLQQPTQAQMGSSAAMSAQLALRNHLWSSLLALQCSASNQQAYSGQQAAHCAAPIGGETTDPQTGGANQLNQFISASQLYNNPQTSLAAAAAKLHRTPSQSSIGYEPSAAQSGPFSLHNFSTDSNDI